MSAPREAALLVATLLVSGAATMGGTADPVDAVDPFIGTGGHGHTYPGATLPFGMVQLSPDTRLEGWDGCSGYHFSDRVVYGFSHTHLSGTGVSDYGDILLMPMTGEPHLDNGFPDDPDGGYASRFSKSTERAGAGWYAVTLDDYGIDVELTATERVGFHRYRLPGKREAHVVLDLAHRDRVVEAALRLVGDREIEGFRRSTGWARDQIVYFVARFSRAFDQARLAQAGEVRDEAELSGEDLRALLSYGDEGGELLVKLAISAVSVDGARKNLEAELAGWDFEATRRAARRKWNDALSRIEIEGGTRSQRTVFYTALYHSLLAPNLYSDVDGRYRGHDGEVHLANGRRHYTVFSLWDTFRATHPLFALLETERTREFIETFLAQYRQGGRLPVWELAGNETDTMIGYHAVPVIVDAWVKGITDFDADLALEAMVHSADLDHFGLEAYRRQGFIGADDEAEGVSKTLEYAYDDYCIARMAEELGRDELADRFYRRSESWRHVLDPETGFMRGRRSQRWLEPFDPARVDLNYTEANSWQYSLFVPHDVHGLIEALGGDESFLERLEAMFAADSETTGRNQADITGLIGQYAHGNEPSHHMAWLYHYAGRPDRTSSRVRQILDELYAAAPDGLSGNEDCGQMSSWFVLAAMGLYPVCPCTDEYPLAAPLFEKVTLHLDAGKRFAIRAPGVSAKRTAIVSAELDGKPLERSFIRHQDVLRGGELVLKVGRRPSGWGTAPEQRPGTHRTDPRVVPAPFARSESALFRERLEVELDSAEQGARIYYSRDGDIPAEQWTLYEGPLVLTQSTRLHFQARVAQRSSPVVQAYFHHIDNDWSVTTAHQPNSQYTAGGPQALVDGLRGGRDWRVGGWQGYQYSDLVATVDLGRVHNVSQVTTSFLQDVRSWIWMPSEVVVSLSLDGETFREVARAGHGISDEEYGVLYQDIEALFEDAEARYVRVTARNYGPIPDWHPGHGDNAFIFVDEIFIE